MWDEQDGNLGHGMDRRDGERTVIVPLVDAAVLLGITPSAAKKRIQRGTLAGQKVGRSWHVILSGTIGTPDAGTTGQPSGRSERDAAGQIPVSDAARSQVDAIRDGLVAPLVALTERQQETIRELERENGRLTAERDALQVRLSARAVEQEHPPTPESTGSETGVQRAWWRFWER